VTILKIVTIKV